MPITIEGTPLSRSVVYRTMKEKVVPPNSARYTPPRNPIGTPIKAASSSSLALPTSAFAMPPPGSPTGVGSFVKKSTVRLVPPWKNRYPRINSSVPTATSVQAPVSVSITTLTIFRRQDRPIVSGGSLLRRGEHQEPGKPVNDNGEPEQYQAKLNERTLIKIAGRLSELVGDDGGDRIARSKKRRMYGRVVADHHGHRHGFSQRPREREKNRAHNALAGERKHDVPSGLPLGCAERQRAFPLLHGNRQNHLPRDGNDKRDDHDGQHNAGRKHADAVKRSRKQGRPA